MLETDFPALLRSYRERAGRSRNALAHDVGVDPSYLTRIEHGERDSPRAHVVEALARGLRLSGPERNRLHVAAGYAPPALASVTGWDDALQDVSDVLANFRLTPESRDEFRALVRILAQRWSSGPDLSPAFAR